MTCACSRSTCDGQAPVRSRSRIESLTGAQVGVVVSGHLRAPLANGSSSTWPLGVAGHAGRARLPGTPDDFGTPLQATVVAIADELAAAAELLMGNEQGRGPVVIARGLDLPEVAAGNGSGAGATFGAGPLPVEVALLSGGNPGALGLRPGWRPILPPDDLSIIANTGDDEEFWGVFLVSPDVDAILVPARRRVQRRDRIRRSETTRFTRSRCSGCSESRRGSSSATGYRHASAPGVAACAGACA